MLPREDLYHLGDLNIELPHHHFARFLLEQGQLTPVIWTSEILVSRPRIAAKEVGAWPVSLRTKIVDLRSDDIGWFLVAFLESDEQMRASNDPEAFHVCHQH